MKKYPFLLLLLFSGLLLTGLAFANRNGVYRTYEQNRKAEPVLSVLFLGASDGVFPWSEEETKALPVMAEQETVRETESESAVPQTEETALLETEEEKEPARYDFVPVDQTYLDDALFIGDSRTQGLLEYGRLQENATFYCKTSLTIYDLFRHPKQFIREDEKKKTLEQALSEHHFGKIYLMLGINELGTGTAEYFFREYTAAVNKIRELQPDAIIFVQAILHVAPQKDETDPIFNNANIEERNEKIKTLENGRDIFYLDANEVLCDENGALQSDWTYDQVHLKAQYYSLWRDFLLEHGICIPSDPDSGASDFT